MDNLEVALVGTVTFGIAIVAFGVFMTWFD